MLSVGGSHTDVTGTAYQSVGPEILIGGSSGRLSLSSSHEVVQIPPTVAIGCLPTRVATFRFQSPEKDISIPREGY